MSMPADDLLTARQELTSLTQTVRRVYVGCCPTLGIGSETTLEMLKKVVDEAVKCRSRIAVLESAAEYQKDVNRKLEQRLLAAEDENAKLKSAAEARNEET